MSNKVDYIEKTDYIIKSEKLRICLPMIIKLKTYIYLKQRKISLTRKNIFKRDKHKCQYCGKKNVLLTIDHIIPKNKGGCDTWENLVSACTTCNLFKADSYLKDIEMKLLRKPKKPHYLIYMQGHVSEEYESWKPYLYMG